MIRPIPILLAMLSLAACREETAVLPEPVEMTVEAVGHYCQMNILEHDGPKAQVHLAGVAEPLFFSQVRDAVAYQRMLEQSHTIAAIYVSDMGAPGASWQAPGISNWILADGAHYVIGADVVGGMGAPDLVPFSDHDSALDFVERNGGRIVALADVADSDVLSPVDIVTPQAGQSDEDDDFETRLRALSRQIGG